MDISSYDTLSAATFLVVLEIGTVGSGSKSEASSPVFSSSSTAATASLSSADSSSFESCNNSDMYFLIMGVDYVPGLFSKGHNSFIFKDKRLRPSNLKTRFQAIQIVFIHVFQ